MTGHLSKDEERLAEALAIQRLHGNRAALWIAERIGALSIAGDAAGVERFREIARAYDEIMAGARH